MKRLIFLLLASLLIVGVVQAGNINNAKDTAYRINETVANKLPLTVSMTHDQLVSAGYHPIRDGDYTILIKRMYYDEPNGTLVTYLNGWNNGNQMHVQNALHIHNPVRWYMPFNDNLNGAALQQAYVQMVASYLDTVPFGQPVEDDTLVIYPEIDGYASDTTSSAYLTLRSDTGASATTDGATVNAPLIDSAASSPNFHIFNRGILSFNTSVIPDDATVSSAKFSAYVTAIENGLGSPAYGITGGTLANNSSIATGDYDGWSSTRYADDIAYASISTSARNNWTLGAAGLGNLSKTSYTVVYMRDSWDINASAPTYVKSVTTSLTWSSLEGTASNRPFIEVVYVQGTVSAFSANVTSGTEPLHVGFTDSSQNTPTNWDWYFGNGTKFSDAQNPSVVLMQGTYTINLYTSNSGGGDWENKTNMITVNAAPIPPEYQNSTDMIVNSTVALTDFQVKVILDNSTGTNAPGLFYTNGTTRGDWADIKFTNTTNSTLSFWKQNRTDGATNSTWWVKVPSIANDNTTIIRLHYGNASQTISYMDMDNTFIFSDDFPGASLDTTNKWIQNSGSTTVSNSVATLSSSGASADIYAKTIPSNGTIIEAYWKTAHNANPTYSEAFESVTNPWDSYYHGMFPANPYGVEGQYSQANSTEGANLKNIVNWSAGTYKVLKLVDTGTVSSKWYVNNVLDATHNANYPAGKTRYVYFGVGGVSGSSLSIDWVIERKYAAIEPFFTMNASGGGGTPSAPVASFTVNKNLERIPQSVTVTDTSTNTPTSWQWSWGDGTANSTTQNPTHQYTTRGRFNIILTATNAGGSGTNSANYVRVVGYENYY